MARLCSGSIVEEGCLVLIHIDERRRFVVEAKRGARLGSDRGVLRLDDVIGSPFGSTVRLSTGVEALVLKPTLVDLMERLFKRRSQVIYPKDHGEILVRAGIGPGSRVGEAGVGSGFTTAILAYYVGAEGRVYGFDVRVDMLETTRRNLEAVGLLDRVELRLHDVRSGVPVSNLDAFILDMPDPWAALDSVWESLKPSGVLVVYMPAVQQVYRLLHALRLHGGFCCVQLLEALERPWQGDPEALRPQTTMVAHTGFLLFARRLARRRG